MNPMDARRVQELRAKIRWLVASHQREIIASVHDAIKSLHSQWPGVGREELLSNSRLNRLRTAAAWHIDRREPKQRLLFLHQELDDLLARAQDQPAQSEFYSKLGMLLWLHAAPPWADTLEELDLTALERRQWQLELRLALALSVLDTLLTLYATQPLQQRLATQPGGWLWP